MKQITIFSTRSFGDKYLFNDSHVYTPSDIVQQALNEYFGIRACDLREIWWTVLQKESKLEEVEECLGRSLSSEDKELLNYSFMQGKNPDNPLQQKARDEIFDTYIASQNDGGKAFLSGFANFEKSGKEQNDPTQLYMLYEGVYAIHLLESRYEDKNCERWVPTLLKCAKALAGTEIIDVRLILHDRDLGEKYANEDVTILPPDDAAELAKGVIDENCHLQIVFFKHTTNDFTLKILGRPFEDERNIVKEVDEAIAFLKLSHSAEMYALIESDYISKIN